MKKIRLDQLLIQNKLVGDLDTASRLIMAGKIRSGTNILDKPGMLFSEDTEITVVNENRFVSRGGLKLEKAVDIFNIDFTDKIVLDIGSSTGGFTDLALKKGAKKVYAVDVGKGLLDYKLRNNPKVIVKEGINFKYIAFEDIGEMVDIIIGDLSFISLKAVYSKLLLFCREGTEVSLLVKPQFEAKKEEVKKGGLVTDSNVHKRILFDIINFYSKNFCFAGLTKSPIKGAKGNIEYLAFFVYKEMIYLLPDVQKIINKVVDEDYSYCCKTPC
jgi:23S rRNA (cytidine1920-2'-O)/16S rRNA (cytidine1409-2'-O)-methyltransferase